MDAVKFHPHATHDEILKTLSQAESDISNVRGGHGVSYLTNYLDAVSNNERMLSNIFPIDVIDRLVRTPDYWALRSAPDEFPTTIQAVSRACDRDRSRLHALWDEVRLEGLRWRTPSAQIVVPDTNLLIGREVPFNEIDWPTLFGGVGIVRVVVPIVVLHELDRLKREGNQKAAVGSRDALKWLMEVLPAHGSSQKSPNLTPGLETTTIETYIDQGPMRRPDPDGDIIGVVRRISVVSEQPTTLATGDLGMRLRAQAYGVNARQLEDPPLIPVAEA